MNRSVKAKSLKKVIKFIKVLILMFSLNYIARDLFRKFQLFFLYILISKIIFVYYFFMKLTKTSYFL